MIKPHSAHFKLFEQATYSGGRFLYWILTPLVTLDSWESIAALSLMNLLTMTIYSSVIGGPSFFKLVGGDHVNALRGYLLCNAVIVLLAMLCPVIYALVRTATAMESPVFTLSLFVLPWVSVAADWARKTQIILGRYYDQTLRNLSFIALWLSYMTAVYVGAVMADFLVITFVFCTLTAIIYLPIRGALTARTWARESVLTSFSVWKHYLFSGLAAYCFGNALFWIDFEDSSLVNFLVLRNYLSPVLLLSLYIESYGALAMQASCQRRQIIYRYLVAIAVTTILVGAFAITLVEYVKRDSMESYSAVFGFVVASTFLIAAIKIPTVFLRLNQRDHLVSVVYGLLLPVWPLFYVLRIVERLPYSGLEVLLAQYVVLLAILSVLAFKSKPYIVS